MSCVFALDGTYIAFGLKWFHFAGKKSGKAAKEHAAEGSYPYMAHVPSEQGGNYGFCTPVDWEDLGGKPKKGRFKSGAVLFAGCAQGQDAIYIHTYGKGQAAVVVLLGGRVFEEKIGIAVSEVREYIRKTTADAGQVDGEEIAQFTLYTSDPQAFQDAHELSLQQLLRADASAAALIETRSYVAVRLLMVMVVLLLGASIAWPKWKQYQQEQELAKLGQQQGPSPAEQYRQALQDQLRQIGVKPSTFATVALPKMGPHDTELEGWVLESTKCSESGACQEEWKRIDLIGTASSLLQAKLDGPIQVKANGDAATHVYKVPLVRVAATREAFPEEQQGRVALQSLIQMYGVIGVTGTIQQVSLFGVPAGVSPTVIPKGIGVGAIPFSLKGPSGLLKGLLSGDGEAVLRFPPNVYVKSVEYNVTGPVGATTFTLEGVSYVKQ